MEAASAIEVRLRNHEARIEANHRSTAQLRDASARHETEIKVTGTEVREIREDIAEIRREFATGRAEQKADRAEQKAESVMLRRTFLAAASTFAMFVVALATLILQAGH